MIPQVAAISVHETKHGDRYQVTKVYYDCTLIKLQVDLTHPIVYYRKGKHYRLDWGDYQFIPLNLQEARALAGLLAHQDILADILAHSHQFCGLEYQPTGKRYDTDQMRDKMRENLHRITQRRIIKEVRAHRRDLQGQQVLPGLEED